MQHAENPRQYALTPDGSVRQRYAQYWYVDHNTDSFIEIKNRLAAHLVLIPHLTLMTGDTVELAPLVVPPFATKRVSIKDSLAEHLTVESASDENGDPAIGTSRWGTGARPGSLLGCVDMSIIHPDDALARDFSGWVVVENPAEGLAMVHPFKASAYARSATLDSVWWRPYPQAGVYYALQNTATTAIAVDLDVFDGAQRKPVASRTIEMPASSPYLVVLADLLGGDLPAVGGIRLSPHDEMPPGTVLARGIPKSKEILKKEKQN